MGTIICSFFHQKVIEQTSYDQPSGSHIPDKETGQETILCTVPRAGLEECAGDRGISALPRKASRRHYLN